MPSAVTLDIGDVDGDGDLDCFVGNSTAEKVYINNGAGTFADNGQSLSAGSTEGVELGDIDGDSDLDVYLTSNPDRVWTNDGAGLFFDSGQSFSGNRRRGYFGDLDGDGDLDVYVLVQNASDVIRFNDGAGTYSTSGQTLDGSPAIGAALGDIDDDGDLDVYISSAGANKVWTNDSSGTFYDTTQSLGSSSSLRIHRLADLDGDGDLDTYIPNDGQANKVWFNDGAGIFTDSGQSLGSSRSEFVDYADMDSDGDLDAIVGNGSFAVNEANKVWLNNGSGTFSDSGQDFGSARTRGLNAGDLNGDGAFDVFVVNNGANKVWFGESCVFRVDATTPANGGVDVSVTNNVQIDFNLPVDVGSVSTNTITVRGQQFGIYPGTVSFPSPDIAEFNPTVDFINGESIEVTVNTNVMSTTAIPLGDNYVVFQFEVESELCGGIGLFVDTGQTPGSDDSTFVRMGDLDGDGTIDAIVGEWLQNNPVFTNDGAGGFTDSGNFAAGGRSESGGLGDLDGDGDLDIFLGMDQGNANLVRFNNGDGSFMSSAQSLGSGSTRAVALGDVDGDGDLDAYAGNGGMDELNINDGAGTFTVKRADAGWGEQRRWRGVFGY